MQYKQTRSGVREGGLHIYIYILTNIYNMYIYIHRYLACYTICIIFFMYRIAIKSGTFWAWLQGKIDTLIAALKQEQADEAGAWTMDADIPTTFP